jgi:GUN4-like
MNSPSPEPQTILFLASNPDGLRQVGRELRDVKDGLQRSQYRDRFTLNPCLDVRTRDIQRALLDAPPSIVHFAGSVTGEAGLIFEDEAGNPKLVDGAALAGLFALFAEDIHCVVLNGCYSDLQAKAIAQHIEYVVGMRQEIRAKAAIAFAVGFYDALGAGRNVEFAFKLGCVAIQNEGFLGHLSPFLFKKGVKSSQAPCKPENYLSPNNPKNDNSSESSLQEGNFNELSQLLESRQWKSADQQTAKLLLQLTDTPDRDCLNVKNLETISCSDLKEIDRLWLKYSNHKFGFSIQSEIWEYKLGRKIYGATEKDLGSYFEWCEGNEWKDYNNLIFNLDKACRGHLPCFFLSSLCWRYDTFLFSLMNKFVKCNL